jgi:hypothetical protein
MILNTEAAEMLDVFIAFGIINVTTSKAVVFPQSAPQPRKTGVEK